jgi:cytochrome c553
MKRKIETFALVALAAAAAAMRRIAPQPGDVVDAALPGEKESRKRRWIKIAALFAGFVAVLGIGGFLVAASGIIPIKASSGHWKITAWMLSFSMHRSFSTHSLGIKAPPLRDPSLVLRGAGAYETGCRPCHGSPDLPRPRVAAAMTPPPPYLPPVLSKWPDPELFSVIKHGVKFTGMPAWPTQQRDDEVWAMVAFLRAMPEMDAAEYQRLVQGAAPAEGGDAPIHDLLEPADAPRAILQSCARCHGLDGRGRGLSAFPRLAGQPPQYLENALLAYARGTRHSGIMQPLAAGLDRREIREIALYYGSRKGPSLSRPRPEMAAAIERGREIARRGIPGQLVPSCADCHGPGAARRNPAYPVLAGQYAGYLVLQLELFHKEQRGGSAYAHLMHPVATRLTAEQMRDVALYYASLGGEQP